jgi:DNA-directed RNA polymerase subunit N
MLLPVRCFSCGFVVGEYYDAYKDLIAKGKTPKEALDSLKINKYCCRRMFISNKDYIDEIMAYQK